uniref:nitrilase-related carbon-nitrogen hydrolase n=1 Tax=uncultured Allisonella sp. TaxID=339338 RepID=UPI0026700FAE
MKKKAALLQMRPEWASSEANRKQVEQLVSRAMEEAEDILVLPELWDTGFFPSENLDSLADVDGCKARNFLSEMARRYRVNIVGGSVLVKEGNCYYNRAYVVNRSGQVTAEYDKVHGFSPAGEQKLFTGGNHTVHFLLDNIPCSMAICYDIRFPEFIRREALEGAKQFFVPAAWPLRRIEHWKI